MRTQPNKSPRSSEDVVRPRSPEDEGRPEKLLTEKPLPVLAYSYVRFSTPEQRKGDSLRRQTEYAAAWCERNGVRLDTSRTLHDLGKSAFTGSHRQNPDRNALAGFLRLVEDGRIARGSFLLVESLDRLTREHIRPALTLLLNLIEAGIRVVQLSPVEVIYDENADPMTIVMALMELSRGNSESAMKSERLGKAWETKRNEARQKGELLTRQLPAWIEERDGTLYPIPEKARAVRRIYQLSAQGFGSPRIVKQLIAENIPPLTVRWLVSYVNQILGDRRATGEFQMRHGDSSPAGDPIANYYPAIVSEDEWQQARAGVKARRVKGKKGRGSYDKGNGFVNLFTGLLRDARDGGSSYNVTVNCPIKCGSPHRVLRNLAAQGRAPSVSFPYATFETAILSRLREVDPAEIIENSVDQPDERTTLKTELDRITDQITAIKENLLAGGKVAALADVLRQLEAKGQELEAQLKEANEKFAHPLDESWTEAKTLVEALATAPDPTAARLRLRAALRRIIDSIWVLVVPRGRVRLAEVRVYFKARNEKASPGGGSGGERFRSYTIMHRPPTGNHLGRQPGAWCVLSVSHPDDNLPFNRDDLRDLDFTEMTRMFLEEYPADMIRRLLAEGHVIE